LSNLTNTKNRRATYANADDYRASDADVKSLTVDAIRTWLMALDEEEHELRTGKPKSEYLGEHEISVLDEYGLVVKWRDAVMEVLAGVCSILGAVDIPFTYTPSGLAMTNGEEVFIGLNWFCEEIIPAVLNSDVYEAADAYALMKGLSYHELSHVRFTPRFNHEPTKTVRKRANSATNSVERNLFKAYNMLEDMRIEKMFVGEFAPAKPLFTNLVMRYIVDEDVDLNAVYTLLVGRDYLSKKVRSDARKAFVSLIDSMDAGTGNKVADKVDALVSEYVKMTFPRDNKRAVEIIEEYSKLISMLHDAGVNTESTSSAESTLMREWEADHPYWADKAHEAAGELDLDLDSADSSEESSSGGESSSEDSDSDSGSDSDSDSSEEGDTSDDSSDNGELSESSPSGVPSHSDIIDELKKSIKEESDKATTKSVDAAKDDLKAVNKKLSKDGAKSSEGESTDHCEDSAVTSFMRADAKKLKAYIRSVFSDIEPEYANGYSSGRLNVRDLINARGTHADVFDVWKEHGEGSDFEVVVAIDTSGSMGSNRARHTDGKTKSFNRIAHESMWAVHRAFSELDIPVTVVEYNSYANVLITPHTKCSTSTFKIAPSEYATKPSTAYAIAKHIFAKSNAEHKLLITMTDGEWYANSDGWIESPERELMNTFSSMGVHSVLVTYEEDASHPVEIFAESGKHNGHDRVVRLSEGRHHLLGKEVGKTVVELCNRRILAG
jgi:Mg-chelatase subunit ChlD